MSYRGLHNLYLSVTMLPTLSYQTLGMSHLFLLQGRHSALLRALTLALLSPVYLPPRLPSYVPFAIKSILGIVFKITFFTIGPRNLAFFTLYIFYSSNFYLLIYCAYSYSPCPLFVVFLFIILQMLISQDVLCLIHCFVFNA